MAGSEALVERLAATLGRAGLRLKGQIQKCAITSRKILISERDLGLGCHFVNHKGNLEGLGQDTLCACGAQDKAADGVPHHTQVGCKQFAVWNFFPDDILFGGSLEIM